MEHKDFLGQPLSVGDYIITGVAFTYFKVCEIIRFTPKMVSLRNIQNNKTQLNYSIELIKIDPHLITMYQLTKENK